MLRSFLSDIYFLVSSKVEFLLHKELSTLFYFDQTGYTTVDRCLMRKRAKWGEPCVLARYPGVLPARVFRVGPSRKSYPFGHMINLLLTELVRSRLLDTTLFSFAFLSPTSYRYVKKTHARRNTRESLANIQTS